MGILDPLFILIGVAGIAFMIYAFSVMKVFKGNARMLGTGVLVVIVILLGDRLMSPEFWRTPTWIPDLDLPGINSSDSRVGYAESGWQELPGDIAILWLSELEALGIEPRLNLQSGWQEVPAVISNLWPAAWAAVESGQPPASSNPTVPYPVNPSPSNPVTPIVPPTPVIPAPVIPAPATPVPATPAPATPVPATPVPAIPASPSLPPSPLTPAPPSLPSPLPPRPIEPSPSYPAPSASPIPGWW